jgi:putative hydrolase of the HAD superfamily
MSPEPLLIFDLGNVVIKHDDDILFHGLSGACKEPDKAMALLKNIFQEGGADLKSTADYFEEIRYKIGFEGEYDRFESIWCSHFSHDPAMEDLVKALAAKHQVVILSNTNDAHWRFLTGKYDILKVPKAVYTSFELGIAKPAAEIYLHVLKAEHRQPEEAIFIDDKPVNVEGARAVGMHGIHFTGREALERDLEALGITP